MANVQVTANGGGFRLETRTDANGYAILPQMRAYDINRVSIAERDLPLDAQVEDPELGMDVVDLLRLNAVEPGDVRVLTYADLLDEVQRFANALKGLGVQRGDRVNIYLPMIPEAAYAIHSVVFAGFAAGESLNVKQLGFGLAIVARIVLQEVAKLHAIDIDPIENPYVSGGRTSRVPSAGAGLKTVRAPRSRPACSCLMNFSAPSPRP